MDRVQASDTVQLPALVTEDTALGIAVLNSCPMIRYHVMPARLDGHNEFLRQTRMYASSRSVKERAPHAGLVVVALEFVPLLLTAVAADR